MRGLLDAMLRAEVSGCGSLTPVRWQREMAADVHRVFGGVLQSSVTCRSCQHASITVEPFLDLSLEVSRVQAVDRALSRFTDAETLQGENCYRCDACKKLVVAVKRFSIRRAPNVLTLHLKRFDRSKKDNRFIEFSETLDLSRYMFGKPGHTSANYVLTGVLVHQGSSRQYGHYVAYVKASNGTWLLKDDSTSRTVSVATVLSQKAYLLFYTRIADPSPASPRARTPVKMPLPASKSPLSPKPSLAKKSSPSASLSAKLASSSKLLRSVPPSVQKASQSTTDAAMVTTPSKAIPSPSTLKNVIVLQSPAITPSKPAKVEDEERLELSDESEEDVPFTTNNKRNGVRITVVADPVLQRKRPAGDDGSSLRANLSPLRLAGRAGVSSPGSSPKRAKTEASIVLKVVVDKPTQIEHNSETVPETGSPKREGGSEASRGGKASAERRKGNVGNDGTGSEETEPSGQNSSADEAGSTKGSNPVRNLLVGGSDTVCKAVCRAFGVLQPGGRLEKRRVSSDNGVGGQAARGGSGADGGSAPRRGGGEKDGVKNGIGKALKSVLKGEKTVVKTNAVREDAVTNHIEVERTGNVSGPAKVGSSGVFGAEGVDQWACANGGGGAAQRNANRIKIAKRRRANDDLDEEYDRGKQRRVRPRSDNAGDVGSGGGRGRNGNGANVERKGSGTAPRNAFDAMAERRRSSHGRPG